MSLTDIVCDASALVELVVDSDRTELVGSYLIDAAVHTTHLAFFESANALRGAVNDKRVSAEDAIEGLGAILGFDLEVWAFHDVAERSWQLRDNLTIYDASYVALAEMLGAPLLTVDSRIAGAPGVRCQVIVP